MGFFTSWFRPKLKHPDAAVRLQAVNDIAEGRDAVLAEVARTDADARVRLAAANKIGIPAELRPLLKASDDNVQRVARERLSACADRELRVKPLSQCADLLEIVADAKSLAELSLHAADAAVRSAAFDRLVAAKEPSDGLLTMVAVQDASGTVGRAAVGRIDRRGTLKDVARKAKHAEVRQAAEARLSELERNQEGPSTESRRRVRRSEIQALTERAIRLAVCTDWQRGDAELAELDAAVATLATTYADLPGDDTTAPLEARIAKALADYRHRREQAQEAVATARAARRALITEATGIAAAGADQIAIQVATLRRRWQDAPAAPEADRAGLEAEFTAQLDRLVPPPVPVSERTLDPAIQAELDAINAEADAVLTADNHRDSRYKFQVLHKRWSKAAQDLPPQHPLRMHFLDVYNRFKNQGKEAREQRQVATRERLETLEKITVEAEIVVKAPAAGDEALRARANRLKELQAAWRSVGPVRPDLLQTLKARFQKACDQGFEPIKALNEAEDWERFGNLAKAGELIAAAEALDAVTELPTVLKELKRIQAAWKQVGPLPRAKAQAEWLRFKTVCDRQYDRLKPWFAEQDASRAANLERKLALLTEAEALAQRGPIGLAGSVADLQAKRAAADRFKAIQEEWKAVGPIPRERDDEVWKRFRAVGDHFYGKLREERAQFNASLEDNLKTKLALCSEAEQFAKDAAAAKANGLLTDADVLRRIRDLQEKFKTIGYVPKQEIDAVAVRWRAACAALYATVKGHTEKRAAEEKANLEKKLALITEVEQLAANENARWFKEDVREMQKKWKDIGFVPREQAEDLDRRFRAGCDRILKDRTAASAMPIAASGGSATPGVETPG